MYDKRKIFAFIRRQHTRALCPLTICSVPMFAKGGPTLFQLIQQALSSTRRGYDLLAPRFDATPFRTPDELLEFAMCAIGQADIALDVCCGTGAAMQFLHRICGQKIVGIDFSSGMLEQARRNLAKLTCPPRLEFVEGDVMQMKFHEEFDLATCFGGLGHIPPGQESAFLHRISRALKPGGRYVFYSGYRLPLLSPWHLALRSFNAVMKLRNAFRKPPFIMYYFNFVLPRTAEMLQEAGFTVDIRTAPIRRLRLVIATKV
jgi:ubiquinone/menaquinone biosynthesis C-methylase UbiE